MVTPATNTEPDFVGVDAIAEKHRAQVQLFCDWAAAHDWAAFHSHHYDWWTFPIDAPSSFGFGYTVYETERAQLSAAPGFLNTLEEAARLLLLSWGWDAITNAPVAHPEPNQSWQHWPIRWSKCAQSLELFGLTDMPRAASHMVAIFARRARVFSTEAATSVLSTGSSSRSRC